MTRDGAVAARPQTDLQRRLESEGQMHHEMTMKRREQGSPSDLGEIDRELTMCIGALEGLYQRIGALAAALGPIMAGDVTRKLMGDPGRALDPLNAFEVETEAGQRIQTIHRAISECEDVLGTLVVSVRL